MLDDEVDVLDDVGGVIHRACESARPHHRVHERDEPFLVVDELNLVGVYDFQRMNQVIVAYHAVAHGEVTLSPTMTARPD